MRGLVFALTLAGTTPAVADAPAPSAAQASLVGPVMLVADPDKEVAFYRDVFGMNLALTLDGGARREYMLRFGDDPRAPGIVLLAEQDPAKRIAPVHGNAFSRLVLRTTDIAGVAARLDVGGYAHEPVRAVAHGYSMLLATTPAGYRIEVVQSAARQ
jgi:catechol 2,3-dioxygenase-like lactoylglutathione lyase family enzyme